MQLKPGTWIVFSSKADADSFRAVAVNETTAGPNQTTVILSKPIDVVSDAYLYNRTAAELQLHQKIDELETRLKNK